MPWPPSQGSGQRFVSAPGTDTVRLGTTRSYSSGAASRHPSARSNSTGNARFRNSRIATLGSSSSGLLLAGESGSGSGGKLTPGVWLAGRSRARCECAVVSISGRRAPADVLHPPLLSAQGCERGFDLGDHRPRILLVKVVAALERLLPAVRREAQPEPLVFGAGLAVRRGQDHEWGVPDS